MTATPSFVDQTVATIALWHGGLRFEDEPSSFTAALLSAAAVEVTA